MMPNMPLTGRRKMMDSVYDFAFEVAHYRDPCYALIWWAPAGRASSDVLLWQYTVTQESGLAVCMA